MSEKKKYVPKTKKAVLAELKGLDRFNLLAVRPKEKQATPDSILVSRFEEINSFVDEHKRIPSDKGNGPIEFQLFNRLLEIQLDPSKIKVLLPYDRYGLLRHVTSDITEETKMEKAVEEPPKSKLGLADKFNLLKTPGSSIFDLRNVKAKEERTLEMPDEIAKREKCKDFGKFEPLFRKCQKEIESGDRAVVKFRDEQDIKKGGFFILNGIKCYVAEVGAKEIRKDKNNARLRLIFENGLESNMYLRSLATGLYKTEGRRILSSRIGEGELEINDKELTGLIYVLASKTTDPAIMAIPNLFKIGFSTTPVADRIKNAKNDPTYLMAEVQVVATYKVAGIKPTYFENIIHKVFGHVQVKLDIVDLSKKLVSPKEWFSVPYDVIDDALKMIQTGEIIGYVYDADNMKLARK
ncbi:MAG: hypothetical protein COT73_11980 [Bdellovibrio sp. CG10_big_fil_rev_8_21_14_0_10_47_8]|nr:MAG: hypothetical protein COT73_11980 [Bdellovibrio sp. CG10_big_fil_rev_8_21_14_0_10_47_8]